jgi:hypothetical protein
MQKSGQNNPVKSPIFFGATPKDCPSSFSSSSFKDELHGQHIKATIKEVLIQRRIDRAANCPTNLFDLYLVERLTHKHLTNQHRTIICTA